MLKRILSGAAGIAFILGVLFLSTQMPIAIDIFIAIVCVIAVVEFVIAVNSIKLIQISVPSIAFASIYPMLLSYGTSTLVWYFYTAIMLSMLIFFHSKISFK